MKKSQARADGGSLLFWSPKGLRAATKRAAAKHNVSESEFIRSVLLGLLPPPALSREDRASLRESGVL